MRQHAPRGSSESSAAQLPSFLSLTWTMAAAATIVLVTEVAYFSGVTAASRSFGQPYNGLLRAAPLLFVITLTSFVALTIWSLRRSELRNQALAQANIALVAAAEIARDADERFHLMFHGNPLPMYVYECESMRLIDANEAAANKYGWKRDQFVQLTVADLRPDMSPGDLRQELQDRHPGLNRAGVWRQRTKDGSLFFAEATVLRSTTNERDHELVLAIDVTDRITAEEALRVSRAALHSLVERAPFGICQSGFLAERFDTVNPAFCRMLGYTEAEALNLSLATQVYATPSDRAQFLELLRRNRRLQGHEVTFLRKDGTPIRLRVSAVLTTGHHPNEERMEVYLEDLTEQSALEQQIRAVQKLEAVGRLAGGVAHDFNNILVVIKLSTEMMLGQITPDSPLSKPLLQVANAAERAAALTKQMLAFSRRQMMQVRAVNVNSVVNDISHLLHRLIGEDIELVTRMADNLANTKLDPDQLGQVVLNLAVNARDAMPRGGTLEIETTNVELDEIYVNTHPPVQPGSYVMLAVTDTGTGIAKSDLPHIFDPFFTTKEMGKGTGLGLSIVYGIVKQSGGYVWVYSEPGQGTTFKLYFPTTDAPCEMQPQRIPIAGHADGQKILVVEDDVAIRGNVRDCLKHLGYTVFEAGSGEAALDVCEQQQGEIDLVLTDVIMPGMGGREMARQLAESFPDIRTLFTSGYTEDFVARREMLEDGSAFLEKPFSVGELSDSVRRLLALRPHRAHAQHADTAILSSA